MKRDLFHVMAELQNMQFKHDVKAHRDLLSFDIYSKIKHMTLHFAKYAGKVQSAVLDKNEEDIRKTTIDIFIICMATANSLNKNLAEALSQKNTIFCDSIDHFIKNNTSDFSAEKFLVSLIINTGRLAKTIESTDHMELGNPRKDIEDSLFNIFTSTLNYSSSIDIDLENQIIKRFNIIEEKQIIKL